MTVPPFKGGQGRSSQSLRADATSVFLSLLVLAIFGVALVARMLGWTP